MAKLFDEIDDWHDSTASGNANSAVAFKKVNNHAGKKEDRKRKRSAVGKYVKAPIYDDPIPETKQPKRSKKKPAEDKVPTKSETKQVHCPEKVGGKLVEKASGVISFQDKLKNNLLGSRFRFLNEQMYNLRGEEALKLMNEDGSAFEAYHEGYRHQISQWPMNPLDRIIKNLKRLPKNYVIADLGCGDGRLAKSVVQKVYSLDLVAGAEDVLVCDMAKTPLETKSINVVVYCLSLMGTNLKDFFLEANRILKIGGLIKIAEVSSRFENIGDFVDFVQKCGFELVSKDLTQNLFYFVNFKKCYDVNEFNKKIPDYTLKPCLYKKR